MKKVLLVMALFVATTMATFAQEGTFGLSVGVEGALPVGDWSDGFGVGIGGSLKGLYGVGNAGQVTLTTGYDRFGAKENDEDVDVSLSMIPILAGYRHNFSSLYLEPQLGVSIVKTKADAGEFGDFSASSTEFTWAIGGGYVVGPIDLGLRYQSISGDGGSTGFIALKVAYGFSL